MRLQDLHTHSCFDDGNASLEQMVRAGIDKKLSAIGLSIHSPISGQGDWTADPESLPDFLQEARRLKNAYGDRITVYCGIEYDVRSNLDLSGFDYVIGSLHATVTPSGSFDADNTAQIAQAGVEAFFDCDADAAAEAFFAQYASVAENSEIDIVGHFDLLTKFDDKIGLYDAQSPRFLDAAYGAMEMLTNAGKLFEINSGAISRGYRTSPYPSKTLLTRLRELNGRILLSSDAHSTDGVGFYFKEMLELSKFFGFSEIWMLMNGEFVPVPMNLIQI